MQFHHVDVFADEPFAGNSVTVFFADTMPVPERMLTITREFRHFESVFLAPTGSRGRWRVRVFDMFEELEFAGHPLLGAAAVLHQRLGEGKRCSWALELPTRSVTVITEHTGKGHRAAIDQGRPSFGQTVTGDALAPILAGLGLDESALVADLDPAVVSTGLRYLVLPVSATALDHAAIGVQDFAERLAGIGAQYVYVLDPDRLEGRHWNNDGLVEDVATGSAAGAVGAYLARTDRVPTREFVLRQGRHVGRPSNLHVTPVGPSGDKIVRVLVSGNVASVAQGSLVQPVQPVQPVPPVQPGSAR